MIAELFAGAVISLVIAVPGILFSFAVLGNTGLGRLEKTLVGIILGLLLNPAVSILEFVILSIPLTAGLVLVNSAVLALISVVMLYRQGRLKMPAWLSNVTEEKARGALNRNIVLVLLLGLMATGFYARFATAWAYNFFEFDPIYYTHVTEYLVKDGSVPVFDTDAYFPQQRFHRDPPVMHYMTAGWYLLFQTILGRPFDKEQFVLTVQFYPPILGALLAFLAFMLLKEVYDKYVGLIAAAFFTFTPQLVKKLGAGVAEQQPFGIFSSLLVFTVYALAINRRSLRLGILAAFAVFVTVLGTLQFIWPLLVIAAFIAIQSIIDYLSGVLDKKTILINAIVAAGGLAGSFVIKFYQASSVLDVHMSVLLLIGSVIPGVVLYAIEKYLKLSRIMAIGGIIALFLVALVATPIGSQATGYIGSTVAIAKTLIPLVKTVQEENATSELLFESSFGVLHPIIFLQLSTIVIAIGALLASYKKNRWLAAGYLVFTLAVVLFNNLFDGILTALAGGPEAIANSALVDFIVNSDVFLFLLAAMAGAVISYYYSEHKNRLQMLFVFIIFPVAYIGLNKLKYLLHLSFALAVAGGFVLGELRKLVEKTNSEFSLVDDKTVKTIGLASVLVLGILLSTLQAATVSQSMQELSYSRISPDWLDSMNWLKSNVGKSGRVLSWWDYGHWTTFFGESNTVLDPGNAYANYDQEVAHALVHGNLTDLYWTIKFHNATHVLVDAELITKWGALVYLSGSCDAKMAPTCPSTPFIEQWQAGPGKSKYEVEHYFEYLSLAGQCPAGVSPVPMPAFQSSFGPTYCFGKDQYFLLTRTGLEPAFKRNFKIIGRDEVSELSGNVSYLFPFGQGTFVNTNPDLSFANLSNNVFNSAFTQLYFFERLPGFKVAFRSPTSEVKIFEYVGEQPAASPVESGFDEPLEIIANESVTNSTNAS